MVQYKLFPSTINTFSLLIQNAGYCVSCSCTSEVRMSCICTEKFILFSERDFIYADFKHVCWLIFPIVSASAAVLKPHYS